MRINEILTESQHLEEGPILNKIGSAVGRAAGGVAKGVGALAGGIAGIGAAAKKGFAAGKKTVAGADDEEPAADNTANTQAAPAPAAGGAPAAQPAQAAPASAAPTPAASAPAKTGSAFSKLATAAAGGAPAAPAAGGTQYAQVKANIDKLDKKGKQRILGLLQKEVGAAGAAPAKPAAGVVPAKTAAPAKPQAGTAAAAPEEPAAGSGAMANMANQLSGNKPNTMANAPVSKTNTAKPGNPNAAPAAEPKPGMTQDNEPHWDPKTGKGAKYDGVTGKATPGWQAELDKKSAASTPPANPLADTPPASKPAPTTAPTTTGKAAANADASGGDPEKAALDAMKAKNPKLAGMMAQAGMDDQGNDVPKKKGRQKAAPKPSQAEIDATRDRLMGVTSDSIIRTRPMMAEGFSLFRKK